MIPFEMRIFCLEMKEREREMREKKKRQERKGEREFLSFSSIKIPNN